MIYNDCLPILYMNISYLNFLCCTFRLYQYFSIIKKVVFFVPRLLVNIAD